MDFKTAKKYIEYLDEQSGESWSNSTDELADAMEDYAKMYHQAQLKLLGIGGVVGQSEQLVCDHQWKSRFSEKRGSWRLCTKCSKEE